MSKEYTYIFNGYDWWLEIPDKQTLDEYIAYETEARMERVKRDQERIKMNLHPSDVLANCIHTLHNMWGGNDVEILKSMMESMREVSEEMLDEGYTIYVNKVGGYHFDKNKPHKNFCHKKDFVFPILKKEDIKIKQWDGGQHYYAYIGNFQIRDGNTLKWDTREEAEAVVEEYFTKNRMR